MQTHRYGIVEQSIFCLEFDSFEEQEKNGELELAQLLDREDRMQNHCTYELKLYFDHKSSNPLDNGCHKII